MIWKTCRLIGSRKVGEDALCNDISEDITVKETVARYTPWTDEQIALEGRDTIRNEQQYAVPIPYAEFPVCYKAEIDGKMQDIKKKIDLSPRYTVIQVRGYKR